MTSYDYFLKALFEQQERTIQVKITSLSFLEEFPQQQIVGKATGGSININGNADIRRTCSLTMVTTLEEEIAEYQWALNNKFSLEIGLYNTIDSNYDNIIWFPMGVYVISSFSHSENLTSVNISIQGKDKMCLLDGSVSGKLLASSYDFGNMEEVNEDGEIKLTQIPIKTIIEEAVHMYAKEPYHNILINDLDDLGLELMTYRGKDPLFVLLQSNTEEGSSARTHTIKQMLFDADYPIKISKNGEAATIGSIKYYNPDTPLVENGQVAEQATTFWISNSDKEYIAMKMEYGDVVGYHRTDLVYAGKLTANLGESITSVLTKIKNQLGQFEYFYNLNGQFVFQKKKNRLQENFSKINTSNNKIEYITEDYYGYEFTDAKLFNAISNTPQIAKIKNDYSIWGQKSGDSKKLIHMRYAIDKKPIKYTSVNNITYTTENIEDNEKIKGKLDWREIIYQMAKDYYRYHNIKEIRPEDLEMLNGKTLWEKIVENNGDLYPLGVTGYEQYYDDMEGFWRQLYCPNPAAEIDTLPIGVTFDETKGEGPWSDAVLKEPETLNFWIDFLDSSGKISDYSIKKIGDRNYGKSETSVTGIFYPTIPEVIYYWDDEEEATKDVNTSAYTFVNLPMDVIDLFSISSRGISAIEKMQETLYTNAFCNETINLTSIPIYSLEVNSLIKVDLEGREQIKGDYIVNSVTIPLTYNGTMSISATKVIDNIY